MPLIENSANSDSDNHWKKNEQLNNPPINNSILNYRTAHQRPHNPFSVRCFFRNALNRSGELPLIHIV